MCARALRSYACICRASTRARASLVAKGAKEKERKKEKESEPRELVRRGQGGWYAGNVFLGSHGARDASLSLSLFFYARSFSVSRTAPRRTHLCVRECMRTRLSVCVYISTLCVPPPKAQVSRSGIEGEEGGGHRRRWTARDAAYRESLREIETARSLCLFVCDRRERGRCERARDRLRDKETILPVSFFLLRQPSSTDDISESHAVLGTRRVRYAGNVPSKYICSSFFIIQQVSCT